MRLFEFLNALSDIRVIQFKFLKRFYLKLYKKLVYILQEYKQLEDI